MFQTYSQVIPKLRPNEAYKYLGVLQCLDGGYNQQALTLKKKSEKYAKAIRACPLTRTEAIAAYFTCYLPAITYPLPASTIPP